MPDYGLNNICIGNIIHMETRIMLGWYDMIQVHVVPHNECYYVSFILAARSKISNIKQCQPFTITINLSQRGGVIALTLGHRTV